MGRSTSVPTDTTSLVVIALSWCAGFLLAVPLWRKPGSPAGKLFWSALLAFPVAGPVAFVILHDPPPPKQGCGSCGPASCGEGEPLTQLGRSGAGGSAGTGGDDGRAG
jgi:hypothetical protein